jgi:diguanylate cyclase (GGDEF)-like protein
MSKEHFENIFEHELEILNAGKAKTLNEKYEGNELLPAYIQLLDDYEKLVRITKKIFRISDSQGKALKRREDDIRNILDHANQGFLTFNSSMLVDKEYSKACEKIFDKKIASLNIIELLWGSSDQKEQYDKTWVQIFSTNDKDILNSLISQLPQRVVINDRSIHAEFKAIASSDEHTEERLFMLILTDITERLKSEAQLEFMSYHDSLTTLYNRAYVDDVMARLTPEQLPLSIIMADMNGLKLTNDVYGHEVGDKLIKKTANLLLRSCRSSDIIARWGGDEFLILLPATKETTCQLVVKRIKDCCQESERDPIEISIALGSATLDNIKMNNNELFNLAESRMYSQKLHESKVIRQNIMLSIQENLQAQYPEVPGHINRLKTLCHKFAQLLHIRPTTSEMRDLLLLVELHDIGKIAIPKEILLKQDRLSPEEWRIMEGHSEIGYRMAQSMGEMVVAESILALHERWDGSGYPYGTQREEIPLLARILAIIDAFDIMTHDRAFQRALTNKEAMAEIRRMSGLQFDPALAELFLRHVEEWV